MPEPKIRFYLHSKVAASGHRLVFLSVGVGKARPMRLPRQSHTRRRGEPI